MVNRPKNIGTAAETAVVNTCRRLGFPGAERRALHGATDLGDILLCPGVVLEVKGGAAAKDASDLDIERWLDETETEWTNANAEVAVLVVQRRGAGAPNAHRWWAWWRLGWLTTTLGYDEPRNTEPWDDAPIRMRLDDALHVIRAAGYGNPLDSDGTPGTFGTLRVRGARELAKEEA